MDLNADCREKGCKALLFPLDVGCRGFQLIQYGFCSEAKLGMKPTERRAAVRQQSKAAEKSFCLLWHIRDESNWRPGTNPVAGHYW